MTNNVSITNDNGALLHTLLIIIYHHLATALPPIFAPMRHRFTARMYSVSNIILIFKTVRESFAPINGTPGYYNMVFLDKTLLNTYTSVRFFGTDNGCASSIVIRNDTYQRLYVITFYHMSAPLTAYDPDMTAYELVHCADKQKWLSKLTNQSIVYAAKWGVHGFILHAVNDTWTRRLKDAKTF